ncbi:MAG: CoA ester lyase, partial [Pseudomonadota bacterium]
LFVPGNRPERFAKAVASGADALILDLEDSVPLAEKAVARDAVAQWLATPPPVPAWIRVNPLTSLYHLDDLQAVSRARPAGIVLPKCEGMDDLLWLDKVLTEIERRNGWPNRSILVMAIATETARAMQRIHSFDHPMPRLAGILWGAEDLAASLGVRSLRDAAGNYLSPALRARDSALLASHACGIPAIDAVFTGLDNPEALAAETRAHAALGFTAKAAIHPAQIAVIHAALRPSDDDLAWAGEVVAELQDGAKASGRVRGGMVDQPHLNAARRLLAAVQRAAQRPS